MTFPLIDTNVISELMRREPAPAVVAWAKEQKGFFVSVVALEELSYGLNRKPMPVKSQWLDAFLQEHCEILPITAKIARVAGALRGRFAFMGITRHAADMLIAATALTYYIPLATRNTADFTECGITLLNPFTPLPP